VTDESTSQITNTHYSGGFQYTEDHLDFFPHAEGYVNVIDYSAFHYVYTYKDHLGNIRLKYTLDPDTNETAILEENHYYPYGLTHQGYNADHKFFFAINEIIELVEVTSIMDDKYKYKFNGMEWQDELDLNHYDFGARNYDAALGRWMNVDPLADIQPDKTPYHFVSNNPITRVDPTGMLDTHYEDEFGKTIVETNDGNDATVVIAGDNVKAFQEDFNNTSVMHQDGAAKNAEWISKYGEGMVAQGGATVQPWAIGALGHDVDYSGVAFAAAGLTLSVGESALEGTTFRLFNNKGTNFSPKLYRSGWRGGSAGQIKTYGGASKGFGFAGKALGWYGVGNAGLDLIQGKTTGVQGIADIGFGIIGTLGGKAGAIISLSYELGKIAGPSKWYGSDDTKWFK
jgi:RHS repeat-associated protein